MYCTGDKVLLKYAWKMKFNDDAYICPYTVTEAGIMEQYAPIEAMSQTPITCATSPLLNNRNDFYYGAVYHRQT